jgi:CHASE3 domain sensor protein
MLDAETGLRGYLLTGDERYLDPYKAGIATLQTTWNNCEAGGRHPEDRQHYEALARTITTKLSEMALSLDLRRKGGRTPGSSCSPPTWANSTWMRSACMHAP